jgi:oligoendopeptidase F
MYSLLPASSEALDQLDWPVIEPWYRELTATALSPATLLPWLAQWSRLSELADESATRLEIAWSQNTANRRRNQRRQRFLETIAPPVQSADQQLRRQLLESGLEPPGFSIPLRNLRAEASLFCEANTPLVREEQDLCAAYERLRAAQTVEWDGQTVSVTFLAAVLESTDRVERERAWRLSAERQRLDREALDALWAKLLQLRQQIARNAGFESYREYRWQQLFRFDYTPEDCRTFHTAAEHVLAAETSGLWEKRRRLLRVDHLRPWDTEVDPRGDSAAVLSFDSQSLAVQCVALVRRIDLDLASYVESMLRDRLLDLDARPHKATMNCLFPLPARRQAYLFANLAGSVRDVFILLHEMGHAFHEFEMGQLPYHHQRKEGFLPLEFAEVASTSMELIGPLRLHEAGLCSERQAAQLCVRRLERTAMHWLPLSARVDAFQHWVYDYPERTIDPHACDEVWAELSRRYVPWVDWSGLEEALGRGWQDVEQIYCFPFYQIEYAIAALGALQIWNNYRRDPRAAIQQYRAALALGATGTLPELFATAGATFAFDETTLRSRIQALMHATEEWEMRMEPLA